MKKFVVTIPNEIINQYLEEFLQERLGMEFDSSGLSNIVYTSKFKPKDFKKEILKNFGLCTWHNIYCERREVNWDED